MTPASNPPMNYITTMAAQSGLSGLRTLENPFFPGDSGRELTSLGRYFEDSLYGSPIASDEFIYHDFSRDLNGLTYFENDLAKAASKLEGRFASRAEQEIGSFRQLIAGAQEANSRLPRRPIDTAKTDLPDFREEAESLQRVRRFLNGRVSLARLALEGRDPARIYFDLDPAEMALALGLSTFSPS